MAFIAEAVEGAGALFGEGAEATAGAVEKAATPKGTLLDFNEKYKNYQQKMQAKNPGIMEKMLGDGGAAAAAVTGSGVAEDLEKNGKVSLQGAKELRDTANTSKPKNKMVPSMREVKKLPSVAGSTLNSMKKAGGISLMLFLVLFIDFALRPVNGYTRLQLLWHTLLGHTHLSGEPTAAPMVNANGSPIDSAGYTSPTDVAHNVDPILSKGFGTIVTVPDMSNNYPWIP